MLYNQLAQEQLGIMLLGIMLSVDGVFFHNRKLHHPIVTMDSVKCFNPHKCVKQFIQSYLVTSEDDRQLSMAS